MTNSQTHARVDAPAPVPTYFGAADATLFGWLHAAPPGSHGGVGVVVCAPFGFEEVCAHRSLMHLASSVAAAGWPALRFDMAGCGNSSGDERTPDTLAAWTRSVHTAIDFLKASTGVQQVCLVGVRLGAALATLAAVARDDIWGLIAIAPVVRGRDYIRELRMLGQSTASGSAAPAHDDGTLETAGFVMSGQTADAVRKIDLRTLAARPAPNALLIGRDDLTDDLPWAQDLAALGVQVQTQSWPGYAAVMTNPQDAQVPTRIIEGIVATLAQWRTVSDVGAAVETRSGVGSIRESAAMSASDSSVIDEAIVRIGMGADESALFGIVTRAPTTPKGAPGVVLLNSGSVHHIGPNRLWVQLARDWAARGVTVLRVDLSGIGDSPARHGQLENHVYTTVAPQDVVDALAYLKGPLGAGESHLLGLCSGAFHALKAVVDGHGVASAVMVNPLAYDWASVSALETGLKEYEILEMSNRYRRRLFSAEPWLRLIRGDLHLSMIAGVFVRRISGAVTQKWTALLRAIGLGGAEGVTAELASASRHSVALRFIFAAGDPGHQLLLQQGGQAFDTLVQKQRVSIDIIDNADHTFTTIDARKRLIATLERMLGVAPLGASNGESAGATPRHGLSAHDGALRSSATSC